MKRDWEMIRKILLEVESLAPNALLTLDSFPEEDYQAISYHLEILAEAGILKGKIHKTPGGSPHQFHLIQLTWLGHNLIDAIRSEAIWQEIQCTLAAKNVTISVDFILSIAQAFFKKTLSSTNDLFKQ